MYTLFINYTSSSLQKVPKLQQLSLFFIIIEATFSDVFVESC